jgi:hypothetical protein
MDQTHKSRLWRWSLTPYPSNIMYAIFLWAVFPFVMVVLAAVTAQSLLIRVPTPKSVTTNPRFFSEDRANIYNNALNNIGSRVINTRNEYVTREYLTLQIKNITSIGGPNLLVEFVTQDFLFNYTVLTNYIVRLSDNRTLANETYSLLVSSHFDTTEFSKGGSDDGSGTSVMLELLYNMMNQFQEKPPVRPIIFLFNDGEESGLLGSKGFLTHPWAPKVRRFINLDSTGSHGKSIMFRLYPSSLITEYHTVNPYTTVIGEEVMAIIPSDTDYTVYKGNITMNGFDFAFYLDGYNYHTALDTVQVLDPGAVQHLGDNLQSLIVYLLQPERSYSSPLDPTPWIYFDAFGSMLVSYSQLTSDLVQIFFLLFILFSCILFLVVDHIMFYMWDKKRKDETLERISLYHYFQKSIWVGLGMRIFLVVTYLVSYILSLVFGILLVLLMSAIMTGINAMYWFQNGLVAIPLYGSICVTTMVIGQCLTYFLINAIFNAGCVRKWRRTDVEELEDDGETLQQFFVYGVDDERFMALFLFWGIAMLISIASRLRSTYIILIFATFVVGVLLILLYVERISTWIYLGKRIREDGYLEATPRGTTPDIYSPSTPTTKPTKGQKILTAVFRNQIHWSFMPYLALFFPLIISTDLLIRLLRMMTPILGRFYQPGTVGFPPDVLVALVVSGVIGLSAVSLLPGTHRSANFLKVISIGILASVLSFIVACVTFPYSSSSPKRLIVTHTVENTFIVNNNTFMNTTAPHGSYLVQSIDYRGVDSVLFSYEQSLGRSLSISCNNKYNCTFPYPSPYNVTYSSFNITSYQKTALDATNTMHNFTLSISHRINYRISVGVSYNSTATVTQYQLNALDKNINSFTNNNFDNSTSVVIHKYGVASNQTIIDIVAIGQPSSTLYLQMTLYSCGTTAQTWLRDLYNRVPWVTAMGSKSCQVLQEKAIIQTDLF